MPPDLRIKRLAVGYFTCQKWLLFFARIFLPSVNDWFMGIASPHVFKYTRYFVGVLMTLQIFTLDLSGSYGSLLMTHLFYYHLRGTP
jgi:hypothetical protein